MKKSLLAIAGALAVTALPSLSFAQLSDSGYIDLSASLDVGGGVMKVPHVDCQKVAKNGDFPHTDYSPTVSKDLSGWFLSAAVVAADTQEIGGESLHYYASTDKKLGKAGLALSVKSTF